MGRADFRRKSVVRCAAVDVLVIANARSGTGAGARAAARIREHLESSGKHRVQVVNVGEELERSAAACGAIVIAGGDGSVHHNAMLAVRAGKPLYHFPCGNENLFAREFGMTRSLPRLVSALDGMRVKKVDLARVRGGGHFVLMASFGCDASVVHRLDAVRSKATGHWAYAGPVLKELRRPCFPRLKVEGDGKGIVDGEQGLLVVANSRQYALSIDPAHEASMTDGMLDVVFLPCRSAVSAVVRGLECRFRMKGRGVVRARVKSVKITACDGAVPYQVDGEAPVRWGDGGMLKGSMEVGVDAGVLPVLLP